MLVKYWFFACTEIVITSVIMIFVVACYVICYILGIKGCFIVIIIIKTQHSKFIKTKIVYNNIYTLEYWLDTNPYAPQRIATSMKDRLG